MWELIVYLTGFFVVFWIATRDGDDFFDVMLISTFWPSVVLLLIFAALLGGLYRLKKSIGKDGAE
ncbi:MULTISPECIES: hypothetical protein [Serratia]|uniref:hypothetical protein n=1 Tax=Serratia TaxID=613 RepID=UPI000660C328|nr:hypothetical protein [Serratia sp. 506_PEND]HBC7419293.1 hypothetical protein [Serratia marcescens]